MSDRDLLHHAAREDFMIFAELAFPVVYPGRTFKTNWHHAAIATNLMEAEVSRNVRQIISMPPRSLKSFLASVAFPAYLLGKKPNCSILSVTYGEKLSEALSSDFGVLMRSDFYAKVFPHTRLRKDTKLDVITTAGGRRLATSTSGAITGFGADWVIFDDPLNAIDAYSDGARESVNTYFDRVLSSRVIDETEAKFIIVMQRLHENDLVGHLMAKGDWHELKLQAKATEPAWIDIGGPGMHEVKVGDLLHEARLPQHVLDRKIRDMGSIEFEAQFQQNPVPAKGNIVKREWLRYYTGDLDLSGADIVLSLDTATKTDPAHDYSVCTVWMYGQEYHRLIDVWRDKVGYPQLKAKIIELYERYRPRALLIEDENNGRALIQDLHPLGIPAIPRRTAGTTKVSRLVSATSYMEAGKMLLRSDAPWLAALESELLAFDKGKHDDQVDSVSQYFAWVRERGRGELIVHSLYDDDGSDDEPMTLADLLAAAPRY